MIAAHWADQDVELLYAHDDKLITAIDSGDTVCFIYVYSSESQFYGHHIITISWFCGRLGMNETQNITDLLMRSFVSECSRESPTFKQNAFAQQCFVLLVDNVSMDIYMTFYILHCTGISLCLDKKGSEVT